MAARNPTPATNSTQRAGAVAQPSIPAGQHPAALLLAQTLLYKFSWPKLLSGNVILGIALLLSIVINGILVTRKPDNHYFATDPHGRLTRLIPLDEPMVSGEEVAQFSQDCVTRSFSLDFVPDQLRAKLNSLHDCYSNTGFAALMSAFDQSNIIQKIRDGRMVSSAVATGAAVITAETPNAPGGYMWTLQQPISITLANQTQQRSYSFVVETHIQRVSNVDNPTGISTSALQIIGNGQGSTN